MTPAGTPALNKPVTRTEAEARIAAALKVAREIIAEINATDPDAPDAPRLSMIRLGAAILKIKHILETR